jgi:hypothetical protein
MIALSRYTTSICAISSCVVVYCALGGALKNVHTRSKYNLLQPCRLLKSLSLLGASLTRVMWAVEGAFAGPHVQRSCDLYLS